MNIVDIKLDELKPYENNPRNNVIIAGHTRYKVAKDLVKVFSNKTAKNTL